MRCRIAETNYETSTSTELSKLQETLLISCPDLFADAYNPLPASAFWPLTMIFYHGTNSENARRISTEGFLPKGSSHRIWFTKKKGIALQITNRKSGGSNMPVVLTCDLDVSQIRKELGSKRVSSSNGILTIRGKVPPHVLRVRTGVVYAPAGPEVGGWGFAGKIEKRRLPPSDPTGVASWVNAKLKLPQGKRVGPGHPGVQRLSDWMARRKKSRSGRSQVEPDELMDRTRQWLSHLFPPR